MVSKESLLRVLSSLLDRAKTLLVEQAAEQRDLACSWARCYSFHEQRKGSDVTYFRTKDDRLAIDDAIGEELIENGIDEATDTPNARGRLCESILEALED